MGPIVGFDLAKSVLGSMGNISSALGAGFIALCYIFLLPINSHFRHKLILNLAVADFMNATVGTFNQCYLLKVGAALPAGNSCTAVGTLVQFSVQAVDVSIFSVAIVTVVAIVKPRTFEHWSLTRSTLMVASIWVLPLVTSMTAMAAKLYEPATGGWCWIKAKPAYLRYVLTHGWRFLIIFIVFILYIYLYIYLCDHYKELSSATGGTITAGSISNRIGDFKRKMSMTAMSLSSKFRSPSASDEDDYHDDQIALCSLEENPNYNAGAPVQWRNMSPQITSLEKPLPPIPSSEEIGPRTGGSTIHFQNTIPIHSNHSKTNYPPMSAMPAPTVHNLPKLQTKFAETSTQTNSTTTTDIQQFDNSAEHAAKLARIRKVLLMRAYPTWFVILWIPGIANRMVEATGGKSPPWLILLQSSTSYVGLANAITYGWNEGVIHELKRKLDRRRRSGKFPLDAGRFA